MAINVAALPAYVEEHRLPIIRKAVIGAKSAELMNLQTGVKGKAALNLLDTTIAFGNGADCGWNEAGASTLSQRVITTGAIKINMSFCDKKLLNKWTEYDVRVAAGQKTLPFEEDFVAGVVEGVKAAVEKAIWQGDTASTNTDVNTNKFDGLVKIIEAATIASTVEYASGATVKSIVESVYAALPSECFQKGAVHIYMGLDMYRAYVSELVAANLYHYNPEQKGQAEYILLPGSDVKVYGVGGLDNTGKVFASYADNFVYGTDLMGDEEKAEMWYSQDNREFRLAIEFVAGVQVAYPDMIVEAKEAED